MKIYFSIINFSLFIFSFFVISCSQEKADTMVYLDYYYEFDDHENSSLSSKTVSTIQKNINGNSYIITNGSGKNWPYYKIVDDPEDFPADSILFPHPGLHRFFPLDAYRSQDGKHFKVKTTLFQIDANTVKVQVVVYEKNTKVDNWHSLVDANVHDFPRKHYKTDEELIQFIEENIILISFK